MIAAHMLHAGTQTYIPADMHAFMTHARTHTQALIHGAHTHKNICTHKRRTQVTKIPWTSPVFAQLQAACLAVQLYPLKAEMCSFIKMYLHCMDEYPSRSFFTPLKDSS